MIRRPRRLRWGTPLGAIITKTTRYLLKKLDKMLDGALVAFGVFLVGFAGFVVIAPDTAKELIFNQKLEIKTPAVQVDVSLGDELTEILKRIEAGLQ